MSANSGGIFTSCNFFACLPPLAVYAFAQYSRYDQRQMQKDRDAKIEKLVEAELEIEVGVEPEEVSAMLNSRNPDLEAPRMRLEAMEEKLMRLGPVMQQTGKPHESKLSIPQQKMDRPKSVVAGSGSVGNITEEKKGEGASEGYWPWFLGKLRGVSVMSLQKRNNVMEINIHARISQTPNAFINRTYMLDCSIVSIAMMVGLTTKGHRW